MLIQTCYVSFSIIVCRYFSKWRINVFLKLKRSQQPPSPSYFDGLTYPRVRWYPQFFFMKMTANDVKEINHMPLVNFFNVLERPGKNCKGGCNNQGVRRGLKKRKNKNITSNVTTVKVPENMKKVENVFENLI